MTKHLYVFIGRPGSGKTTLLRQLEKEHSFPRIDILRFISKYLNKEGGLISEVFARNAYLEMYDHVKKELEKNSALMLELGTNYPRFNINRLKELEEERNINLKIFLCMLSIEECRKRCALRKRQVEPRALERRLKRLFPQLHKSFLERAGIEFVELPMEKPVKENIKFLEKFLK